MTSKQWIRGMLVAALVVGSAVAASRTVQAAQAASVEQSPAAATGMRALHTHLHAARPEATSTVAAHQEAASAIPAPAPVTAEKPVPYTQPGEPPAHLRRLKGAEVPVPMRAGLHKLLRQPNAQVGALIPTTFEGKTYIARVEVHYHPDGGPVRPWGNHRGISLFVERE